MECWVRACKDNVEGECQRYKNVEDLKEDFEKGGGCAFTWFFTGKLPQKPQSVQLNRFGCGSWKSTAIKKQK